MNPVAADTIARTTAPVGALDEIRHQKKVLTRHQIPYENAFARAEPVFLDGLTVHSRSACETRWTSDPAAVPSAMQQAQITVAELVDGPWQACECFRFTGAVQHDLLVLGLLADVAEACAEPSPLDAAVGIHSVSKRTRFVSPSHSGLLSATTRKALEDIRGAAVDQLDDRTSYLYVRQHHNMPLNAAELAVFDTWTANGAHPPRNKALSKANHGTHIEALITEWETRRRRLLAGPRVLFLAHTLSHIRPQTLRAMYEAVFTVDEHRFAGICAAHTAAMLGEKHTQIPVTEETAEAAFSLALQLWEKPSESLLSDEHIVLDLVSTLLNE